MYFLSYLLPSLSVIRIIFMYVKKIRIIFVYVKKIYKMKRNFYS